MDENALIVQRIGSFANRFRNYRGCPKGPVGFLGPAGDGEYDEIGLLLQNLTAQTPMRDVEGEEWTPVNGQTLRLVADALEELRAIREREERKRKAQTCERGDDPGEPGSMGY